MLGKTLGVPIFQEQAMKLAMVAAGFSPGQADQLRRAIAAKRNKLRLEQLGRELVKGMTQRGYSQAFAQQCFKQFQGFSEYGFPESHAASFALLVYASAWLKRHYPAEFAAALLNSQPMGFYAPAQIIADAQRHGVGVRGVDVNFSSWDCTIEPPQRGQHSVESVSAPVWARPESVPAVCGLLSSSAGEPKGACRIVPTLRLGMRMVKGLGRAQAAMIQRARLERESARQPSSARRPSLAAAGGGQGWPPPIIELAFADIASLQQASGAAVAALRQLAAADAFASMGLGRQAAMWQILALDNQPMPLFNSNGEDNPQISQIAQISNSNCNNKDNPQIAQISLPQPTEARCAEADLLPQMTDLQEVLQDYQQLGLSLRRHPMSFLRKRLQGRKVATAIELRDARRKAHGSWASVAGIVLVRQRPSSAAGVLFLTLEDETGSANVMVRPAAYLRMKKALAGSVLLVAGKVERAGEVVHVLAERVQDITGEIRDLAVQSRNFR